MEKDSKTQKKVVVIGGGTGNFSALSGLKYMPVALSAIVSMSDSGGHSGKLRDELGVLPPGDVRACLVALADDDKAPLVRDLFSYRFDQGSQKGASVGNLLLTALGDILGGFDKAVDAAHKLLDLRGRVIPVSLEKADLLAELEDGTILFGEMAIDLPRENGHLAIKRVWLQPRVRTNPKAEEAVREADMIVFGPGDLYTSIMPNLCTAGMLDAIRDSKGLLVANVNIMTKHGETDDFSVQDFVRVLESVVPRRIDRVLYNNKKVPEKLIRKYRSHASHPVRAIDIQDNWVGADLLSTAGDLIRHDSSKLAAALMEVFLNS